MYRIGKLYLRRLAGGPTQIRDGRGGCARMDPTRERRQARHSPADISTQVPVVRSLLHQGSPRITDSTLRQSTLCFKRDSGFSHSENGSLHKFPGLTPTRINSARVVPICLEGTPSAAKVQGRKRAAVFQPPPSLQRVIGGLANAGLPIAHQGLNLSDRSLTAALD